MNQNESKVDLPIEEENVYELLLNHFGDGLVYLPLGTQANVYIYAVKQGYISNDGYITRKGRLLLCNNKFIRND